MPGVVLSLAMDASEAHVRAVLQQHVGISTGFPLFEKGVGGWEKVREQVEGQQYTSIVPSSMGGNSSQAGSKIQTMCECISSL